MKTSFYNISVKNQKTKETVLFNTLYGSMTTWDEKEFVLVTQLFENRIKSNTTLETAKIYQKLIQNKYLIQDEIDEIEIVKNRKCSGVKDSNRLDVIIMPNMNCNFSCPYCYERHNKSSLMTESTETAIRKWLSIEIPKYKVILLNWFGGEPLLSYSKIISIGKFVNELCERDKVGLLTNITTNGYLLNSERIKALTSIPILSYQITIDGPPDIHNKTRKLKNGVGTFDKIYKNILLLVQIEAKVKISLRVNFNHNNIHSIPDLLNIFPYSIRENLKVVFEPIFGEKHLCAVGNIPDEEISFLMSEYYRLADN